MAGKTAETPEPEDDAKALGAKIKTARKAIPGMTQSELGRRLNPPTSWRTVAHWERGDYQPKTPRREQIGVILGIDIGGIEGLAKGELLAELLQIRSRVDQLIARL